MNLAWDLTPRSSLRGVPIEKHGGEVVEMAFIVDLPDVGGKKKLIEKGYKVFALTESEGEQVLKQKALLKRRCRDASETNCARIAEAENLHVSNPCPKEIPMANSDVQKATDDLKAIAPEFAKLTQDLLFGDIWKRPGLSQRDKSLITVTCLVALNRIEQVEFHLKKAFENGLTKEELVAAITHIAFYAGWPTAASGFSHLKKVIDQK